MNPAVPRSVDIGGWLFPSREDYLESFGIKIDAVSGALEIDAATAISIQRDWHSRGQNGCAFAMHAARKLTSTQWSATVHNHLPDPAVMCSILERAGIDPDNQIHSFIFPNVTVPQQLRELVAICVEAGCVLREHEEVEGEEVFRLRWMLGEVESWMVGFASMEDVPPTRRAPFTELVVRTKPRTRELHPDLNNDPGAAHVANVDLAFDQETVGRLIANSKRRTARLLGGPEMRAAFKGAKAKTTYGLVLHKTIQ